MGVAVPLAAGAKAAAPERTIVAVVAGGGLELGTGELATLRDEGLHIVVIVIQDESLALIELKQKNVHYEHRGVELGETRFEEIAVAFGGHGVRVTKRDAFADELVHATRREMFSVIVCQVEASDYVDGI
jgi:acetolactate synthase-1/2/3 large subunit